MGFWRRRILIFGFKAGLGSRMGGLLVRGRFGTDGAGPAGRPRKLEKPKGGRGSVLTQGASPFGLLRSPRAR